MELLNTKCDFTTSTVPSVHNLFLEWFENVVLTFNATSSELKNLPDCTAHDIWT